MKRRAWQLLLNGPGVENKAIALEEGKTSLGRGTSNQVVLGGKFISREHVRFTVGSGGLYVEDLGSRNGTRVNGVPLTAPAKLKVGDAVTAGENTLTISLMTPASATPLPPFKPPPPVGNANPHMVLASQSVDESEILRALDSIPAEKIRSRPLGEDNKTPTVEVSFPSLVLLYKTSEKLAKAKSLQEFLEYAVELIKRHARATTAVTLIKIPGGAFVPAVVQHDGQLEPGETPVSDGVVEEALTKGAAVAVMAVQNDARFARRESVVRFGVNQVLCAPIGTPDAFVGALYLAFSGKKQRELESLVDLSVALTHLIAAAFEKFKLDDRVRIEERLRTELERFHSPEVVHKRAQELAQLTAGSLTHLEQKSVYVLFADLGGLAELRARLKTPELMDVLSDFYRRATSVVFSFRGTLVNIEKDEVMALFGTPYAHADDGARALGAAQALRQQWAQSVGHLAPAARTRVRVGLDTGKALVGTVDSQHRLDYMAVGDPITVAMALCRSAEPGQVLATERAFAQAKVSTSIRALGERALGTEVDRPVPVVQVG